MLLNSLHYFVAKAHVTPGVSRKSCEHELRETMIRRCDIYFASIICYSVHSRQCFSRLAPAAIKHSHQTLLQQLQSCFVSLILLPRCKFSRAIAHLSQKSPANAQRRNRCHYQQ